MKSEQGLLLTAIVGAVCSHIITAEGNCQQYTPKKPTDSPRIVFGCGLTQRLAMVFKPFHNVYKIPVDGRDIQWYNMSVQTAEHKIRLDVSVPEIISKGR
ncbi:MAG: hypothetical protein ACI3XR_03145 [Eubacteriales bacterium]